MSRTKGIPNKPKVLREQLMTEEERIVLVAQLILEILDEETSCIVD